MASDLVYAMVDFDGTGNRAFEFTVSLGGAQRDGTISNERDFSYDWDARWQSAVREEQDRWIVEMLIPWSVAPMRDAVTAKRTLGIHFGRFVESRGERYAWPPASFQQPRYISDFARVQVDAFRESTLDFYPYVSAVHDFVGDGLDARAGFDVFWKPSGRLQLNAAIKPDFGQVESDDLVVNFDAIETFFSDKRPFFTENQALFDVRTARGDLLLYTRRIGGPRDNGSNEAADIDAAIKLSGSAYGFDYGAFVASEADEDGRDFYAVRTLRPGDSFSFGHLATFTDRPFLDRQAWVNTIDARWRPNAAHTVEGKIMRSDIRGAATDVSGAGSYVTWLYAPNPRLSSDLTFTHYDRSFDINDAGFLRRSDLNQLFWSGSLRDTGPWPGSRNEAVTYRATASYLSNDSGDRLVPFSYISRTAERVGGGRHYTELRYDPPGFDDLISRGNGLVRRRTRFDFWHYYDSPRLGPWKFTVGGWLFQEGLDEHAFQLETEVSYQFSDRLDVNLLFYPRISRDWLIWRRDNLLASYERVQWFTRFDINWFPAPRHELRLKGQWIVIDAENATPYRIGSRGALFGSNDVVPDFTVRNFGLQLRYRYEIAPQRELYVVYGRGGFALDEDVERNAGQLFLDAFDLRDSDQLLVKLRWHL